MPEQEKDLSTLIEDVKIIKSILQNTDAAFPPVWRVLYFVAFPALLLIGLAKFLVPVLAAMSFLDTVLWLWLPAFGVAGTVIAWRMSQYLKKTGTRFMAQGRVQIFLYTRLILVPSVLTIGYLLSLNPAYSMDGAMAVLVAVGLTQVTVIVPSIFRAAPFFFLVLGWAELALGWQGPLFTLANTLCVSATLFWIATLLQRGESQGRN